MAAAVHRPIVSGGGGEQLLRSLTEVGRGRTETPSADLRHPSFGAGERCSAECGFEVVSREDG